MPAIKIHDIGRLNRERLGDPYLSSEDERFETIRTIIAETPSLMAILTSIRDLELPDSWLVSGGIYQTVWNALTDRPASHGIKDYDIIYFDGSDLSFEAEDIVIRQVEAKLPSLAGQLETRNQARVHLWYEKRFGQPYAPLSCSMEALTNYAAKTHAVAARLRHDGKLDIHAPFGLSNIFAMRIVPNYTLDNSKTHAEKGKRMQANWQELNVMSWQRP
ncbi:nucleotidyltransferase family protein [Roseibium algae]|uniref:Nucleotidyltransferase family protein n=1 Tax=Roseibium algae TaxID=3123038 RepID=A0ABU8TRU3_9HYPH